MIETISNAILAILLIVCVIYVVYCVINNNHEGCDIANCKYCPFPCSEDEKKKRQIKNEDENKDEQS